MGKLKIRQHSESEHYRGEIKKIEIENRKLRRRLKDLEKRAHFYEEVVDEVADDIELKNTCPSCKKGILQEIDLKHILISKCQSCGYQTKKKPRNGEKSKS